MRFFHYFLYTVFVSSAHKPNSLPVFCYPKLCWWDDPTKQLSIMEQKPQWYDVRSVYMDGMTERMDKGSKNCATMSNDDNGRKSVMCHSRHRFHRILKIPSVCCCCYSNVNSFFRFRKTPKHSRTWFDWEYVGFLDLLKLIVWRIWIRWVKFISFSDDMRLCLYVSNQNNYRKS